MSEWEPIIDERLVDVYGVDTATLQTNRRGKMTEAQLARLQKRRGRRMAQYAAVFSITLLSCLILGTVEAAGILGALLWLFRAILLVIALIEAWRGLLFYWRTGQEIRTGEVRMYPGRLHKIVWNKLRIMYCERGEFYSLPMQEWNAFDHYQRYRVFCTPRSKVIVAAQPVHKDEPLPEAWA